MKAPEFGSLGMARGRLPLADAPRQPHPAWRPGFRLQPRHAIGHARDKQPEPADGPDPPIPERRHLGEGGRWSPPAFIRPPCTSSAAAEMVWNITHPARHEVVIGGAGLAVGHMGQVEAGRQAELRPTDAARFHCRWRRSSSAGCAKAMNSPHCSPAGRPGPPRCVGHDGEHADRGEIAPASKGSVAKRKRFTAIGTPFSKCARHAL